MQPIFPVSGNGGRLYYFSGLFFVLCLKIFNKLSDSWLQFIDNVL
jgi:hypothetical protein